MNLDSRQYYHYEMLTILKVWIRNEEFLLGTYTVYLFHNQITIFVHMLCERYILVGRRKSFGDNYKDYSWNNNFHELQTKNCFCLMWFMGKQNKISNTRSRIQYYIYCRTKPLPSYRTYYFMMAFFVLVIFSTNHSYRTDTSIEPYPSFCWLA